VHEKATQRVAADFLNALLEAVLYKIHAVITDNGMHFPDPATPNDIVVIYLPVVLKPQKNRLDMTLIQIRRHILRDNLFIRLQRI
jgi:hypothetical protein